MVLAKSSTSLALPVMVSLPGPLWIVSTDEVPVISLPTCTLLLTKIVVLPLL